MSHDRIGLCWFAAVSKQLGPSLGLVASDLQATERARRQVCKVQILPCRLTDTWPFLPQEFTFFLTQVTFQPPPPLLCLLLQLSRSGHPWVPVGVGSLGGSVPPLSQGGPCVLCSLPHPTCTAQLRMTSYLMGTELTCGESDCTQVWSW